MHDAAEQLRTGPAHPAFPILAIGDWPGNPKFGNLSLCIVTGALVAGVLAGQPVIAIPLIPPALFIAFLFAAGCGADSRFSQGLENDGNKRTLCACARCVLCFLCAWAAGIALHHLTDTPAGLLSISGAISTTLGAVVETIAGLTNFADAERHPISGHMAAACAVACLFGAAGSAWSLVKPGLKNLRAGIRKKSRNPESSLGATESSPDILNAYVRFVVRSHTAPPRRAERTICEIKTAGTPPRPFAKRLCREGKIIEATPDTPIGKNAVSALFGQRQAIMNRQCVPALETDAWGRSTTTGNPQAGTAILTFGVRKQRPCGLGYVHCVKTRIPKHGAACNRRPARALQSKFSKAQRPLGFNLFNTTRGRTDKQHTSLNTLEYGAWTKRVTPLKRP